MAIAKDKQWLKGRNKFPSGYCNEYGKIGAHEGTKPRSSSGVPLPTCPMWDECPCVCHYNIDKMWEMVGRERAEGIPNPEYVKPESEFVLPTRDMVRADNAVLLFGGAIGGADMEGTPNPSPQAVLPPPTERRTPTGRAGRGTLEAQVFEACMALSNIDPLTPKLVAGFIAGKYHIPTPSSGAIQAVWIRWEKNLELGKQLKKPVQWGGFTNPELTWEDVERMKQSREVRSRSASVRIDSALSRRK